MLIPAESRVVFAELATLLGAQAIAEDERLHHGLPDTTQAFTTTQP